MTTGEVRTIFDCHTHVGPAGSPTEGRYDVVADRAFRTALMDRSGIRASVLMASHNYERPKGAADTQRQNDFVAWYRNEHRERFPVALGTVEPLHGEAAGVAELHRMKEELALDGVVWHNYFSGATIDDPRMVSFARTAAGLGLPVFVHLNVEGPLESAIELEVLAQKVPEASFVALAAFSTRANVHELRIVGEHCPNVSFETSLAYPMGQPILHYAERFGSERVLFGTDLTVNPQRVWSHPIGLADILESDRLSEADRANILWRNAERLFPALAAIA